MNSNKIIYLPDGYFDNLKIINEVLFTAREIDVIACIANMRGVGKIASILGISSRTAETHIANIKRKIDKVSRESIIDFVEKSAQSYLFRKHYQNLLIQADFIKRLKAIFALKHKAPVCYLFGDFKTNKELIVSAIQKHLKAAGIKLITSTKGDVMEYDNKQEAYFIYIISNKNCQQIIHSKAREQALIMPNNFIFLSVEDINFDLGKELAGVQYIDFTKQENYYLTIFEILKRLLPDIDLAKAVAQLKSYHASIIDLQHYVVCSEVSLEKRNKVNLPVMLRLYAKQLIIIVILLLTILSFIFGYNALFSKKSHSKKFPKSQLINLHQSFLLTESSNMQLAITSYVPEILTGYEDFIGREKELLQINDMLNKENMVIISGCAGIGKSSLAAEYGKQQKMHKVVRYFHAASKTKLDQQYRELAQELNISVDQQSMSLIMQLINNKLSIIPANKLLFIFDNVDNYDDAKEYLTNLPVNIQVIITTRKPMLIANKTHIVLEEFTNQEAEKYLKASLQHKIINDQMLHELVEGVGTLPYDIKCAAAFLHDNQSIDSKLDFKKIGNKIQNKLFLEFIVSSDKIKQQSWKILQYSANLDPDFINMDIIKELFPEDLELFNEAIKKLESLSLISIINKYNEQFGFRIHRKLQKNVQDSVRNYPRYVIEHKILISNLLNVLDKLFPEIAINQNSLWPIAASFQSHVEKILNNTPTSLSMQHKINQANLYYKLAKYNLVVNINYTTALEYARKSLKYRQELYKTDNLELANTYNVLGVIYRGLGQIQEGLKYLLEALKIRQKIHSGDHPDIAESLFNLGRIYRQLGDRETGLKYSQMSLNMNKRLYPNNHYETAYSLKMIGLCYIDLGDFEKSLEYFKEGLNIFTTLYPDQPDKIADLLDCLAYNYNKLGKHQEAVKYARSAVKLILQANPDGSPVSIYCLNNLGDSLIKINNIKEGLDALHQALNLSRKFKIKISTAWILYDLGCGYFKNKDYQTALQYAQESLTLRKEMYGNVNHVKLAESLYSVGDIYFALSNKTIALQLYKESLDMYIALSLEHLPEITQLKQKIKKHAK